MSTPTISDYARKLGEDKLLTPICRLSFLRDYIPHAYLCGWDALREVGQVIIDYDEAGFRRVAFCRFLGIVVPLDPRLNAPSPGDIFKFGLVVHELVTYNRFSRARLMDPAWIPLTDPEAFTRQLRAFLAGYPQATWSPPQPKQALLAAYAFSDYDDDELNAWLDARMFTKEGELPGSTWPSFLKSRYSL